MARLAAFAILTWLLTGVSCLMEFINPPPFGTKGDFSGNPIYVEDSTVNIAWTEGEAGKRFSLVLYQLHESNGSWFGDMEYLTKGTIGEPRYLWLVGTRKDLLVSNLFYLSLYEEGQSVSLMNSHYFNIEAKETKEQSPSLSSSSSSLSSSPSTSSAASNLSSTPTPSTTPSTSNQSSSSSPTNSPTNAPSPENQSASTAPSSSNFPIGTIIGIGVGIIVVLVMCLGAALLLYRRRRNKRNLTMVTPTYPQNNYHYPAGSYYGSNLNEAPLKSPVEMGQHQDFPPARHDHQDERVEGVSAQPVRFEI